jgi:hypothetical protein
MRIDVSTLCFGRTVNVAAAWSHSNRAAPTSSSEVLAIPGSISRTFGGASDPSEPTFSLPCPFTFGRSCWAKPEPRFGGRPVLHLFITLEDWGTQRPTNARAILAIEGSYDAFGTDLVAGTATSL